MKKIIVFGILFLMLSCKNKEVLLPMAAETVVANVKDHSPIYFFFKTDEKDTLVEVNRKNAIGSTNWLFNIDRRLPLRKVLLEVQKLQNKKEEGAHKNEAAGNYFTYTDTVKKNLAFLPFTKVKYKLEIPDKYKSFICFKKNGLVKLNDVVFSKEQLPVFLNNLNVSHPVKIIFSYDKDLSFGEYIEDKLFVQNLKVKTEIRINHELEYIY